MILGPPPVPNRRTFPYQGTLNVRGLPVYVENAAGTYREGKGWRVLMYCHYGEVPGTLGTDGDPVDVFVGPYAETADTAYVVHQREPGGRFDEDKVFLGFRNRQHAERTYRIHYDDNGRGRIASISIWPVDELIEHLGKPAHRGKPLTRSPEDLRELRALGKAIMRTSGIPREPLPPVPDLEIGEWARMAKAAREAIADPAFRAAWLHADPWRAHLRTPGGLGPVVEAPERLDGRDTLGAVVAVLDMALAEQLTLPILTPPAPHLTLRPAPTDPTVRRWQAPPLVVEPSDKFPSGRSGELPVWYASGMNAPAQIRGMVAARHPFGVSLAELSASGLREVLAGADTGIQVFVDSGAFAEIGPDLRVLPTSRGGRRGEITEAEWDRRFAIYDQIARAYGPRALLVAPDRIADADYTLALQRRYWPTIKRIAKETGARWIWPVQPGPEDLDPPAAQLTDDQARRRGMRRARAWRERLEGAGLFVDQLPGGAALGLPSNKAGGWYDMRVLAGLVREHSTQGWGHVHLLGRGNTREFPAQAVWERVSDASNGEARLSLDSVQARAMVGRDRQGGRRLTAERDRALAEVRDAFQAQGVRLADGTMIGRELAHGTIAAWLDVPGRRVVAAAAQLDPSDAAAFIADPAAFLADPTRALLVEYEIDGAYAALYEPELQAVATQRAIARVFEEPRWTPQP